MLLVAVNKMAALKMREWKNRHGVAGGGKCRSGKFGTKMQEWNLRECFLVSTFAHMCVCICTYLLRLLSVQNKGINKYKN